MGPTLTVLWNNKTNCLKYSTILLVTNVAWLETRQWFPMHSETSHWWEGIRSMEGTTWIINSSLRITVYGHLDGTVARPDAPLLIPDGSTASTEEQVSKIEKYTKDMNQYSQEQAIVFQQIALTIPDSLYLKIEGRTTMKEAWDVLKADFKKRSCMITIKMWKRLQDTRCSKNRNIQIHFDTIWTMWEELASLGTSLGEQEFPAIILGSLPKSYDQFISAVTATASVLKQELNPEDLMQTIINEYDRQSTRSGI